MTLQRLKNRLRMMISPQMRDYLHGEITCDVEKCCNLYGFGIAEDDWHYLAATMRQLLANPTIPDEETFLWRYFHNFQPRNMLEALYDRHADVGSARAELARYRDPERGPMPWSPSGALVDKHLNATFLGDYGPWPEDLIRKRLRRIASVVEFIQKEGYRHDKLADPDDCIRGVMIKHKNDWRMVIIGGNHRASALAALGQKYIPVQAHRSLPTIVDIAVAAQWPAVRTGRLKEAIAKEIALRYFNSTGIAKAKSWGIL
jgi:hypothetical protein